tara:strand:+ start:220 stop:402 length:183 start_codon:yes stop_codon:yes gene_type:complete
MDVKKGLIRIISSLILSPVIVYIILGIARFSGANYEVSNGEAFIIWILMAILIRQCFFDK